VCDGGAARVVWIAIDCGRVPGILTQHLFIVTLRHSRALIAGLSGKSRASLCCQKWSINSQYEPVKANTKEETSAELAAKPHRWRIYTDGGCGNSGKGKESGAARWGCYIEEIDANGNIVHVASL
jgi:hypothetical protein